MLTWANPAFTPSRIGIAAMLACGVLTLAACESSGGGVKPQVTVTKAKCGKNDRAETGLQGQIPAAERAAGFAGFNCNLELVGAVMPKAGGFQFGMVRDRAGHVCGYGGGSFRTKGGTVVVDFTDPRNPKDTAYLETPGMLSPGEGLRTHQGRGLLMSAFYVIQGIERIDPKAKGPVIHGFDIYDVGTDCRHPKLLSTTTSLKFPTVALPEAAGGSMPAMAAISGHEGAVAPDGLTYYVYDGGSEAIHAIDISDPRAPKWLAWYRNPSYKWEAPAAGQPIGATIGGLHGMSASNDGNRLYPVSVSINWGAPGGMVPQTGEWHNSFYVVDTSEVQARKPNPRMRAIAEAPTLRDQSAQQMSIPVRIKGKPYVIIAGEGGTGQFRTPGLKSACAAGLTPFSTVHFFDIADEQHPRLVNKLVMEANDPANCKAMEAEINTVQGFIYDVHMCAVDNRDDATTLACGFFQSGIRVYDIRDPKNLKEIAYFNPGVKDKSKKPGTCAAIPILDAKNGMIYSTCSDGGVMALKFTNGVWPFPESKTPDDRQL